MYGHSFTFVSCILYIQSLEKRVNTTNKLNTFLKSTHTTMTSKRRVPEMNKNAMSGYKVFENIDREGDIDFLNNDMLQLFKVPLSTS